jgi:hypothetical protein
MENTKMTNVKAIEYVLNAGYDLPSDVIAKLETMKATFTKKNSRRGKSAKQIELDNSLLNEIVAFLETVEKATATEIMRGVESETSSQKIVALVKNEPTIQRVVEKRQVFYKLA